MSETPTIPPYFNYVMKLVLRSPLHGLVSKTIMLLTFSGCKSGKTYTTPVSYSQYDDQVHVFSHADWWKNLCGGAPVTMRLRGREVKGLAEAVAEDKQAVAAGLAAHFRKVPFDARYYNVTFDEHKEPRVEEIEQAAQTVVMINIWGLE